MKTKSLVLCLLAVLSGPGPALAADWPMWRCDAGRTAATEEELPAQLHLQWVRRLPPLEPAWTGVADLSFTKEVVGLEPEKGVGFEVVYSPVVMGRTLFFGSSRNDAVTAVDVETGEEKWRFYTEGPVRLAPAAWNGKVYAASDDGFLYCLNAADGSAVWKFRGAPMKRRAVGDERLVSAWPARGGPAVSDGKVFFAAGIYPFMEVYIHCVDAESGKPVWVNGELGTKWDQRGVQTAPQGPLAVVGDKVLVPNNRLSVTCLDRGTGKLAYHPQQSSHWRTGGAGGFFFLEGRNGQNATLHDLKTGNVVAQLPGVPVLCGGLAFWADRYRTRQVLAGDPAKLKAPEGNGKGPAGIQPLWSFKPSASSSGSLEVKLRAGPRLYVACGKRVFAVDIPKDGGEARESWSAEVGGEIGEVLAAAGRLFVVTRDGGIHCYGAGQGAPKTFEPEKRELPAASDEWAARARQTLDAAGVRGGYALVLGIGSGRLVEELARHPDIVAIGVDPDAKKVDALRRRLDAAGLYGKRAQVIQGDPLDCGLPPYLASLVTAEDCEAAGLGGGAGFVRGVFNSLRPYGGSLCLPAARAAKEAVEGWARESGARNAEVSRQGEFTVLRRAGPLPGAAPWTHQFADAGNTLCSADDLVRAPLGLLWFGGPSTALAFDRHYCGPRPHVVGGRMFVLGPKGLTAVDVYTGRILWQTALPEIVKLGTPYLPSGGRMWDLVGANRLGSPCVSLADGIYVASGKTCLRLDPATGGKLSEIPLPAEGAREGEGFGPIRIWEDVLVAAAGPIPAGGTAAPNPWLGAPASRRVVAFDRNSGKVLWSVEAAQGFCHNAIALGGGRAFLIDRWSASPDAEPSGGKLLVLDIRSGKKVWDTGENVFGSWLSYSAGNQILLQGGRGREGRAIAYDASSGKVLWDGGAGIGPWIVNGGAVISQYRSSVDIRTGKALKNFPRLEGKSCDQDIGGTHIIVDRAFSIAYLDLDTGRAYRLGGVRSGCMNANLPADGVLSCPYFATGCGCELNIRASMALVHMPELAERK